MHHFHLFLSIFCCFIRHKNFCDRLTDCGSLRQTYLEIDFHAIALLLCEIIVLMKTLTTYFIQELTSYAK